MELHALTALQLGEKIRAGEVSPVEAAQAALDRVRQEQGRNNAFITVLGDAALSEALETEKQLRAGARLRHRHAARLLRKASRFPCRNSR